MVENEKTVTIEEREVAVRAELRRILDSPAFRTSKRCREFLEHVVEHTLNGPIGTLKERLIGVELFQLPTDFDTGQHTVVRVTANEVRKKLAQYYLSENGACHPVTITLPPGSYSADFKWEELNEAAISSIAPLLAAPERQEEPPVIQPVIAPPTASPVPDAPPLALSWASRLMVASAAAVLLFAVAYAVWHWTRPAAISADSNPSSVVPVSSAIVGGEDVRMVVGLTHPYLDRSGRNWSPERFFSGGSILLRPSERVLRTLDPDIYRHLRIGEFQYNIPLQPGSYEMHLHFAETGLSDFISAESSGEGQRVFRVAANGARVLDAFDVVADAAGANVADERVFRGIAPAADGYLHLNMGVMRGSPMLSALELLPVKAGAVRPVRIRAGWTSSWQDSAGQPWRADSYFLGGNALVRTTNPAERQDSMTTDIAMFGSERWGHFSYSIPVADGRYRVKLKFVEGHYGPKNTGGGGVGSREFDVYSNGVALLRRFDILKEAGGEGRPIEKVFSGIQPNAQGKIVLTFVPVKGMACVSGIEVVEDTK